MADVSRVGATCAVEVNVAVTVLAAVTVMVVDAVVELTKVADPVGLALHAENAYPVPAVAVMACPATPASYHAVEGTVPEPVGLATKVTWYCVLKLAATVAAAFGTV